MDGSRPAPPGWLLESAVDQPLGHQCVEVEAGRVGVDAEPFGEFSDTQRILGDSQCFEYRGPAWALAVVLVRSGHGGQLA